MWCGCPCCKQLNAASRRHEEVLALFDECAAATEKGCLHEEVMILLLPGFDVERRPLPHVCRAVRASPMLAGMPKHVPAGELCCCSVSSACRRHAKMCLLCAGLLLLLLRLREVSACRHTWTAVPSTAAAAAVAHSALHCVEANGSRGNCWVACCIEDAASDSTVTAPVHVSNRLVLGRSRAPLLAAALHT
jgi:hypothetical protein